MRPIRVAVVADYPEEGWTSMDLVAEMLLRHLASGHGVEVEAIRVCPPFRHRLARLPFTKAVGAGRNADRVLNRFGDYPRFLRRLARREPFDVYHVVDHSYAQLIHALPAGRTVVTCHDLDAFRCLLRPEAEPRPAWFRALARRILDGMRKAEAVVCDSEATRDDIRNHGLIDDGRMEVVHLGIPPEFFEPPGPEGELEADRLVGPATPGGPPVLLHVGSTIPRKRIDVLLDAFAGVRRAIPGARLVRVGGPLTSPQADRARVLGVREAIETMPRIGVRTLAALYRRADLVVQTSEAEGFGLPLAESMASGAPLLVSDLAVFREVAGDAAVYRPVGDAAGLAAAALDILGERARGAEAYRSRIEAGLARASGYRWDHHARRIAATYRRVARPGPVVA